MAGNRPNLTQMHAKATSEIPDDTVKARLIDEIADLRCTSGGREEVDRGASLDPSRMATLAMNIDKARKNAGCDQSGLFLCGGKKSRQTWRAAGARPHSPSSRTILATRRPISTAKLVPRSHG